MKNTTPMQVLKPILSQFKTLKGFSLIELNRKKGGITFVGNNTYTSKPVTFDYLAILGYGDTFLDEKWNLRHVNTLSLGFLYTATGTPSVRAGVGFHGRVDYSKTFDVATAKELLKEFLIAPTPANFIRIFGIVQSSTLTDADVIQLKTPYVEKVCQIKSSLDVIKSDLRTQQNILYHLQDDVKAYNVKKEMSLLIVSLETLQKQLHYIFSEESKDIPFKARDYFLKETQQIQVLY